jgi:hypothetical protein
MTNSLPLIRGGITGVCTVIIESDEGNMEVKETANKKSSCNL